MNGSIVMQAEDESALASSSSSATAALSVVTGPKEIDFHGYFIMDTDIEPQPQQHDNIFSGTAGDVEGFGGNVSLLNIPEILTDNGYNNNNYTELVTWDTEFRDATRFWVQHVFVPVIVIIGVLGNIVTIFILTRRQMRTSSNV